MQTSMALRFLVPIAAVLSVAVTSACGGASADGPPEIVEGRTECDECHMIIDDTRFAAAYRLPDGTERRFDDIGDMVTRGHRNGELGEADVYVFDYYTKDPLLAKDATFIVSSDVLTPMAWGVIALAAGDDVDALLNDVEGIAVDWPELKELAAAGEISVTNDELSD